MHRFNVLALALLLLLAACSNTDTGPSGVGGSGGIGSGSGSGGGTAQPNGSMSAKIDGATWSAGAISVVNIPATGPLPGQWSVSGADASRSIGFGISNLGPGTYTTASATTNFVLSTGGQTWQAVVANPGGSGTVTFTTLTSNRATGTFSFTAVPLAGSSATGTKVVTSGVFDVTF